MNMVFMTVDLGFGDAGKGSVVDFLTRAYDAHTVVRYNGGAQAGHRVVTAGPPPQEHVFAQFGAGTLAGAGTHLSRFMILDPLAMLAEEEHLRMIGVPDAFARTTIDARALVITPFGRAINRLRELARGGGRHGSCGVGVGETVADALARPDLALRAGDVADRDKLYVKLYKLRELNLSKLAALRPSLPSDGQASIELDLLTDPDWADWLLDAYAEFSAQAQVVPGEHLRSILNRPGVVVFEGAQGVLLDEWRGFHPHTTWSTTTLQNADTLLTDVGYTGQISRLGITRAYATRHGAGPMPSEDAALTTALPDARNGTHAWQQGFRVGWLDVVLLRYALNVVGHLDGLAVTCLDRVADLPELQICRGYQVGPLRIEGIIPALSPHDLAYQEQITIALAGCRPIRERLSGPDDLLRTVQADLGLPIMITSYGPTAEDKEGFRLSKPPRRENHKGMMNAHTSGPIALLGSGEYTAAMDTTDRRLLAALGVARPKVALIPAASGLEPGMPERWNRMGVEHFTALGAEPLPLSLVVRADAERTEILAQLRQADLFYFSGGNPEHLVETLRDTSAWAIIAERRAGGAGIAGCSAGAMMMSAYTLRVRAIVAGQPPRWIVALGVAPQIAVMPHFDRMSGFVGAEVFRMLMESAPEGVRLVGIDEDTALITLGPDAPWEVSGRQSVVLMGRDGGQVAYRAGQAVPL